jgi:lysophospholipase L1-like esterase
MTHPFPPTPITFEKARLRQLNTEARYAGIAWPWIVLGDSRASDWPEDLLARLGAPIANLGLPGVGVAQVLWQLHQTQLDLSGVRQAIVVLGINHLTLGHDPQDIAQGVQHVVRAVRSKSAAAQVLVAEVFPRTAGDDYDDRARIELNRRLANRGRGSGLFRTAAVRLDDPADPGLFRDGLHLTHAGYEMLTEDIRAALGGDRPPTRAAYLRQEFGDVIVLADLGEGRPLIEDLPKLVDEWSAAGNELKGRRLIGREPSGRYFAVELSNGRFQGLRPMGCMPLAEAIAMARALTSP